MAARGSADLSPRALAEIRAAVEPSGVRAELLDLKGEADRLYSRYLSDALRLAFGGLIAIVVLLSVSLRSLRRMMRVVAPLALSVLVVAAGLVALGHALTILHLVGMLLIVAVGSNYALFFDRAATHPQEGSVPLTLASLLVANLATVLAFGVLASSSVPVLADLGSTVAPGTFLALLFAAVLAQPGALAPVEAARA
jgi:predicted exporter